MISRARRVKTVNLEAVSARAAYKRPSATLVGNCQLGSLTTGSPAGHLNSITELEKRTVGSVDASRTTQIARVCAREAGKESSPGCAARSGRDQAEPEGFKCAEFRNRFSPCNREKSISLVPRVRVLGTSLAAAVRLNEQYSLQDLENNTSGILQSA